MNQEADKLAKLAEEFKVKELARCGTTPLLRCALLFNNQAVALVRRGPLTFKGIVSLLSSLRCLVLVLEVLKWSKFKPSRSHLKQANTKALSLEKNPQQEIRGAMQVRQMIPYHLTVILGRKLFRRKRRYRV